MKDQTQLVPSTFARLTGLSASWVLPVFFLILFGGAILLGPVLYALSSVTVPYPFHRCMDRALLISALVALAVFWPRLQLRVLWPRTASSVRQLLLGYAIAFVSAQAMIGFNLALGGFTSSHLSGSHLISRVFLALVAAVIVPPLEETLFRGFVLVQLIEAVGRNAAWIAAALIFAMAHFIKVPTTFDHETIHWWSGASALGAAFVLVGDPLSIASRSLNLLLIGLLLGGAFLRSGTLWFNAGLHSGWIFLLLLFSGLTRPQVPPRVTFFGGDLLSNPSTTVVLILTSLWVWRYYLPQPDSAGNGPSAPLI